MGDFVGAQSPTPTSLQRTSTQWLRQRFPGLSVTPLEIKKLDRAARLLPHVSGSNLVQFFGRLDLQLHLALGPGTECLSKAGQEACLHE